MFDHMKLQRRRSKDQIDDSAIDPVQLTEPAGGRPLEPEVRASLEPNFSHDFSQVRIFDDHEADRASRALSARAFTVHQNVFFRSGEYAPHTSKGLHTLAHELTHTIQQSSGPVGGVPMAEGVAVSEPGDPMELAAEQAAEAVVAGEQVPGTGRPSRGGPLARGAKRAATPNEGAPPADPPPEQPPEGDRPDAVLVHRMPAFTAGSVTIQRMPGGPAAPPEPKAPPTPGGGSPKSGGAPPVPTATPTPAPAPTANPKAPPAPKAGGGAPGRPGSGPGPAGPGRAPSPDGPGAPPGLPANPGGGMTPQNPSSGIDWAGFFQGTGGNVARSALEVSRLIPGWGLLGGLGADAINIYQDLTAVPFEDAPVTEKLVYVRSAVMVINNGVGHIAYVAQLASDGVAVSGVLAPLVPVTATAQEAVKTVKVVLDGTQFMLDFSVGCAAAYHASISPPPKNEKWTSFANNYTANVLGDGVAIMFDIADLGSGGVTNTEVIKQGSKSFKAVFMTAKYLVPAVRSVLQGWFGVFGGNIPFSSPTPNANVQRMPAADPDTASQLGGMAEAAAYLAIKAELLQIKNMYQIGDVAIDLAGTSMQMQIDQMNRMAKEFTGGKDPFVLIRDATQKGIDEMHRHIGQLTQMQFFASSGKEKAAAAHTATTDAIAKLDAIVIPTIEIPKAELGDNAVANAGEAVLNMGGSAANAGIEATLGQLRTALDLAKNTLRSPLETVRDHATEIGDFLQVVDEQASSLVGELNAKVGEFSEKLGKCQNVEQVIDLIVAQIMEAIGIDGSVKIDDVRQGWRSLGPEIDAAIKWADGKAASASRGGAAPVGDDASPASAGAAGGKAPARGPGAALPPAAPKP